VIAQEQGGRPFSIESIRPIQMSKSDILEVYGKGRASFTTQEWIDFLIRSIGLESSALSDRAKKVTLLRMVPFVERNYNLVELGPRGTGKSHSFPANLTLRAPDFRRQSDGRKNVRQQCHRPARPRLPIRRGVFRRKCQASLSTRRTA